MAVRFLLLALALALAAPAAAEDFTRAEVEAAVGRPFHGINLSAIGPYRPDMVEFYRSVGEMETAGAVYRCSVTDSASGGPITIDVTVYLENYG